MASTADDSTPLAIALCREEGHTFVDETLILPHNDINTELNYRYVERLLKFLLWQKGGSRILIAGCEPLATRIAAAYSEDGKRAFDAGIMGNRLHGTPLTIQACSMDELPSPNDPSLALGGHLDGCRIGFDLGGSDRKCAALIDGKVIYSDEVSWDPYFETDPQYHRDGIQDCLSRAAASLPRVDAIGGSAAGVLVNSEVRVSSLFRGVSDTDFDRHVRGIFLDLKNEWPGIPIEVVNDGEVTALAGAMSLNHNSLLGISMGTSLAGGYCNPEGRITTWLNELAFAPVDYQEDAPADEWSGDEGCGVQYFSQQAVARLMTLAGIDIAENTPLPERLVHVQERMAEDCPKARQIYETIGVWLGYTIAHYSEFYDLEHLLLLGRVMTGRGGEIVIEKSLQALQLDFPELHERMTIHTPDETMKRHGQAIAAASLPAIP
jgi:predicted NBD/HSP70 family sugar kinase